MLSHQGNLFGNAPQPAAADTKEEFAATTAKVRHALEQIRQEDEYQADDGPRTKREMKQEERMRQAEEARKRSIASICKQLAKVLHPDLEPDAELRERKSALMQELTAAYRGFEDARHALLGI